MAQSPVTGKDHVVVFGSSAGGIEALAAVLGTLPKPFPAPVVIAQHLDPRRPSHLEEILGRRSAIPVVTAADNQTLEAGKIYVVPSSSLVAIADHRVRLRHDDTKRPMPSVDLLLSTAAESYGENAIAVILSGTGSDGVAGAREIKRAGGTVIIQDPATAEFPGMPEALPPHLVDAVCEPARIGPLICELIAGTWKADDKPSLDEQAVGALLGQVSAETGVDFTNYKPATIRRRLQRRLVATECADLPAYTLYLKNHSEEYRKIVDSFLIKVTDFMRDPELFEYLRQEILPKLVHEARERGRELRIWSAGCATGEEPYSLAMLLSDLLGDELDQFHVRIFATDLDPEAVEFARRGSYTAGALRDLPSEMLDRHFIRAAETYQVKKRLRALTVFGEHDLAQRAPFPRIDLIVCRNVLIYFVPQLQRRALQLFAFSLRTDGFLALGKAESVTPLPEFFTAYHPHHKVFQRQGGRTVIPIAQASPRLVSAPKPAFIEKRGKRQLTEIVRTQHDLQTARDSLENLLKNLPVGVVLVNRQYDIQQINAAARRLLAIYNPAVGEDLVHLAQNISHRQFKAALDAALQGELPAPLEDVRVETASADQPRYLRIACYPRPITSESARIEQALVLIQDTSDMWDKQQSLVAALNQQTATAAQNAQMVAELQQKNAQLAASNKGLDEANRQLAAAREAAEEHRRHAEQKMAQLTETNASLTAANEELASGNEQLRTANEEFLVTAEEAQAATEEVETLNEELQSTNEELETLNEELQSTIEELNTSNADLEAQTRELQRLTRTAEEERARLAAILLSMSDAVCVVAEDGKIALTNQAYNQMFGEHGLTPLDPQRAPLPEAQGPLKLAAAGKRFRMEFGLDIGGGATRFFEANGGPLETHGRERGVVVIRDITARMQTDEALREETRRKDDFMAMLGHELRNPLAPIRNAANVIERIGTPDPTLARMNAIITRQVTHLTRIVDDLLDVSRINRGKILIKTELLDLTALARTAVQDLRPLIEKSGLTLDVKLPDSALFVTGDPTRLTQVIGNLMNNANKFTDRGGHVRVELAAVADAAVLTVTDTGMGLELDMLESMFQPFMQSRRARARASAAGLGLGLALVKGLVELHHGKVEVHSEGPGKGAQFVVRLPLAQAPAAAPVVEKPPAVPASARRILVVEDNFDAASSLHVLLELKGHQVAEAHAAKEGLETAKTFRPEVVLCDIGLPGEMDGYDFARAARQDADLKRAYLIAMTGFGQEEDRRRALAAGFDVHLTKPAAPDDLERLLAAAPAQAETRR